MKKEFVRNPYNYDSDEVSNQTGLLCKDESRTEQEHIAEADINYIAEKFMRTGQLPQVLNLPTHGDFEGIFDFQTAMNTIQQAKQEFMQLPAKVRARFGNDPAQLLEFVQDDDNYDEAVKLGFIPKRDTLGAPSTKGGTDDTRTTSRTQRHEETSAGNQGAQRPTATAPDAQKSGRETAETDRGRAPKAGQ